MQTETNVDDPELAPTWLWKPSINILRMRDDGVPVIGFTRGSLTDQVDGNVGLRQNRGRVNPCGRSTWTAARGGLFQLTDRAAGAQYSR